MNRFSLIFGAILLLAIGCTSSMRYTSTHSSRQIGNYPSLQNKSQNIRFSLQNRIDNEIPIANVPDSTPTSFQGLASYYGNEFHGRMTSNGEIFDQSRYTAAHRSLPFGTFLLVTNLKNDASVVVRINDRGPFKIERVLDLSIAAAEELDMIREGVQEVSVKIIE